MKKLKRFNKSNKKNIMPLVALCAVVAVVSAAISYAVYQKEDEILFINAKVGHFETSSSDIELALTLDGEDVDVPPSKGDGYYNVVVECDNADGAWNSEKWLAEIGNITSNRVKCNVNFETYKLSIQDVEIGDYISMTPTSTNYTPSAELTGCLNDSNCTQNTINPSELNLWRVIRKNEDGTVDAVSEYVSSNSIYFYGKAGYINFVKGLNTIAAQYTDGKHIERTRHIGYSNQTEIITSTSKLTQTMAPWEHGTSVKEQWTGCNTSSYLCGTDESLGAGDIGYETDYSLVNEVYGTMIGKNSSGSASSYFLASRVYYYGGTSYFGFSLRCVNTSGNIDNWTPYYYEKGYLSKGYAIPIRPIITFKSTAEIVSGVGTSSSPYKLKAIKN